MQNSSSSNTSNNYCEACGSYLFIDEIVCPVCRREKANLLRVYNSISNSLHDKLKFFPAEGKDLITKFLEDLKSFV